MCVNAHTGGSERSVMDSLFGVQQKLVSLHGYPLTKAAAVLQEAPLPGMAPRGAGAAPCQRVHEWYHTRRSAAVTDRR